MSAQGPLCEPVPLPAEDIEALAVMRREGKFPISSDEQYRLSVLHAYNLLDTGREQGFDRLTKLGQRIFDVPIILVSLVDTKRQWFKSSVGLGAKETAREHAFCNYVVTKDAPDVFTVLDTYEDDRFKNNILVTGAPFIRFYAGAAVKVEGGVKLGTFCIIDTKPHPDFGLKEQRNLIDLAGLVSDELELRMRSAAQLTLHKQRYISCAAHDLQTPVTSFQLAMDMLADSQLNEEQSELVDHARTTVDLMRSTLSKAVAMGTATPGSKGGDLKWKRVVLGTLVERVKKVMSLLPKQVQLVYEISGEMPRFVWTDETLACQCCLNFLTNAADATAEGKIICRFRKPESAACAGGLRVEVEDTGTGVDETAVALFEAFPQRDADTAASKKSGLGLGLFSVLTSVRMLGGECGGGNRNDGTTGCLFWFEVPSQTPERAGPSMSDRLAERMRADMTVVRSRPESKRSMRRRMLDEAREQANEIARVFVAEPTAAASTSRFQISTDGMDNSSMSADVPDADNKSQRSARQSVSASAELAPLPDPSADVDSEDDDEQDDDDNGVDFNASGSAQTTPNLRAGKVSIGARFVGSGPLQVPRDGSSDTGSGSEDPLGIPLPVGRRSSAEPTRGSAGAGSAAFESCALSSIPEPSDGALAIVVDDSAVVRKMVARALRSSGFRVDLAANGREAADMMCSGTHYALALVDFLMPVCDGVECVTEYREWEETGVGEAVRGDKGPLKILGMSANAGESDVQAGRDAGMNDFMRKPMSLVKLRKELESIKELYEMVEKDKSDSGTMFSGADVPEAAQGPMNAEVGKAVLTQDRLPRMPNLTTPEPGMHSGSLSMASQEDIADMGVHAAEEMARRAQAKADAKGTGQ